MKFANSIKRMPSTGTVKADLDEVGRLEKREQREMIQRQANTGKEIRFKTITGDPPTITISKQTAASSIV